MSAPAKPVLGTNACQGTSVLALVDPVRGGYRYESCPGCAGCDRDAVAARMPAMTSERAFALLPTIDDEEW